MHFFFQTEHDPPSTLNTKTLLPSPMSGLEEKPPSQKKLTAQQWLLLLFFTLEVIFYPFLIDPDPLGGTGAPSQENVLTKEAFFIYTWVGIFIWVPIAVVIGYLLGRQLGDQPKIVKFFQEKKVSPEEIPAVVGIFAPLAVIAAILLFWATAATTVLCFRGGFILFIPIYLYYKLWRKKGLRVFYRWVLRKATRLVARLAIRMKRMSYLGYVFPIFFGALFARWLTRGAENTRRGSYVLILLQMIVLIALWRHIRNPIPKKTEEPEGKKPTPGLRPVSVTRPLSGPVLPPSQPAFTHVPQQPWQQPPQGPGGSARRVVLQQGRPAERQAPSPAYPGIPPQGNRPPQTGYPPQTPPPQGRPLPGQRPSPGRQQPQFPQQGQPPRSIRGPGPQIVQGKKVKKVKKEKKRRFFK